MVLLTDDRRWDAAHTAVPGMQPLPRRGDSNTDPTDVRFAFEGTFAVLREKFAWSWENVPLFDRVTNPAKGRYPDACFDGFLVRGARILSCKPISIHGVSDHFPVVLTLAID